MIRKSVSGPLLKLAAVLACVAGYLCLTGCVGCERSKSPGEIDGVVAGGGFLLHGLDFNQCIGPHCQSSDVGTWQQQLIDTHTAVSTSSLIFAANSTDGFGPFHYRLYLPGTGGVEEINLDSAIDTPGTPGTTRTISTGTYPVFAVWGYGGEILASHTSPPAVSVIANPENLSGEATTVTTIPLAAGRQPTFITGGNVAADPHIYVISQSDLVLIGAASGKELASVPVDSGVDDLAYSDYSNYIVAPSIANDVVYVFVDSSDNTPPSPKQYALSNGGTSNGIINIPNGSPVNVALGNYGKTAYVTIYTGEEGMDAGFVDVIDLDSGQITNQIQVGHCPTPIAIVRASQQGSGSTEHTVVVGNQCEPLANNAFGGSLTRIDIASLKVIDTTPLSQGIPNAIATFGPR